MCLKGKKLVLPLALFILSPVKSFAGNGANFVLYDHHTAEAGEMEVMLMNDLGQEPDGTRYAAQMVEFEVEESSKGPRAGTVRTVAGRR